MARVLLGNVRPDIEYLKTVFAPAGYGLGAAVCAVPIDGDVNNIDGVGFFQCHKNTPIDNENWYIIALAHVRGTYEHQIAIRVTDGARAERTMVNGVWGEWERADPPMAIGVEYRTTERWNGKPVYAALVNVGAFPESGTRNAPTGITATKVIRFSASFDYASLPIPGLVKILVK